MAPPVGTYLKYDAKGLAEDVSDIIYDISPEETPFISGAGRGERAESANPEWQIDALEAPDVNNAHLEGDDATFATPTPTTRISNFTQISRKTISVSGTLEAVKKYGRKSELARQIARKGRALKRDQETIALTNQGGEPGAGLVARRLASLAAWVKTNVDKAANGVDPSYTGGTPPSPRTDGTQRALTETLAKGVVRRVWERGGSPRILFVGPFNKTVVSVGFTGIAQRTFDLTKVRATAIIGAADVWVTDFGTLRVEPNRFQRERDAWVHDPDMVSIRELRPYRVEQLSKTGDSEKRMMLTEWTLQVNNEEGLGLVADLLTA